MASGTEASAVTASNAIHEDTPELINTEGLSILTPTQNIPASEAPTGVAEVSVEIASLLSLSL